jgi:hypothetical protein
MSTDLMREAIMPNKYRQIKRNQTLSGYLRKAKRDRRSETAAESRTSWKEALCKHQSSHCTKVRTC